MFWCFALAHQRRTFTDGHRGGAGEPSGSLCEVGEECGAFALQSELDRSTVGGGLSGYGGEGLNEGDVLGAGHYIGDTAGGGVDVSGGEVSSEIGSDVRALAHGGSGGLDLVALMVSPTVMGQVVGLVVLAREGVAHPLLSVLAVVGVLADKVRRKSKLGHGCSPPFFLVGVLVNDDPEVTAEPVGAERICESLARDGHGHSAVLVKYDVSGHGVCSFPWWLGSCPCLYCTTIIAHNAREVNHQNAQTYAFFKNFFVHFAEDRPGRGGVPLLCNMHKRGLGFGKFFVQNDEPSAAWKQSTPNQFFHLPALSYTSPIPISLFDEI